jgi:hypothetical protein
MSMTRVLSSFAFAAAITLASGAFAQTPPPVTSATVNNVPVSGATASPGSAPTGLSNNTNLLGNFTGAVPAMPVLAGPTLIAPTKDCANC